ncbi:MAG: C39 family peptidase, partial [Clostridia bacterium]|nr:C39 family peptidase [Clostridia bacterium]
SVEISVSYQTSGNAWSGYYSFGLWKGKTGYSYSTEDSYAEMDQDTFIPKYGTSGKVKFKVVLKKNNTAPVLRNITVAAGTAPLASVGSYPSEKYNAVKVRRQDTAENGSIGPVICSATTTAMMLEWYGVNQTTLTVAAGVKDTATGAYGDWIFNMAYAGEMGMTSYCDFYSIEMTKYVLSQGSPVGCSIKGTLPGSRVGTTSGHLVLAVGYKTISGVNYLLVNDPYCYDSNVTNNTPFNYKESDFYNVWIRWNDINNTKFGVAYVFEDIKL